MGSFIWGYIFVSERRCIGDFQMVKRVYFMATAGGQRSQPSLRSGVEGEALGADLGAPGPAGGGRRALGRVGSRAGEGRTLPESEEATADRALGCTQGSIAGSLAVVACKSAAQAPLLLSLPPLSPQLDGNVSVLLLTHHLPLPREPLQLLALHLL